jgi:hypothetical protein
MFAFFFFSSFSLFSFIVREFVEHLTSIVDDQNVHTLYII